MRALFGPLKNGFGGKGGRFDPWANRTEGIHLLPKHIFGWIERKPTLLRVSCGRVERTITKIKN